MDGLSTRQRALLDFLLAYHSGGFSAAERDAFPGMVRPDLDALIEGGLVEVRFVPLSSNATEARVADIAAPVAVQPVLAPAPARKAAPPAPIAKQVPAKAARVHRATGVSWDADRRAGFLVALAETGNVAKAEIAAGIGRNCSFRHRSRDPVFAAEWQGALAKFRAAPPSPTPLAAPSEAIPPAPTVQPIRMAERPASAAPTPQRRRHTVEEIAAQAVQREQEQRRIKELRPAMSVDEAKLILQRKGRIVHAASVTGGPAGRWKVSGFADFIDDAMLKAEAERVEAQSAK